MEGDTGPTSDLTGRPAGGAWQVSSRDRQDGSRDINFQLKRVDVPADQLELKNKIERTYSLLLRLYAADRAEFNEAFDKLLSLAQVGLVGPKASTPVAAEALSGLHAEIVDREAGRVKNAYVRKLGSWAAWLAGISACVGFIAADVSTDRTIPSYCALWVGCMLGTWLSFSVRKVRLGFFDLAQVEDDQLDPGLRLIFTGSLTVVLGLVLQNSLVQITVGEFSAREFLSEYTAALLLGSLAGLAEKALPSHLAEKASSLFADRKAT